MPSAVENLSSAKSAIADIAMRHDNIHLLFSGGKDSLACAALLHHMGLAKRTTLVTVDTGAMLPEIREFITSFAKGFAGVRCVRSDVHAFIRENGFPTDVVVADNLPIGKEQSREGRGVRVCTKFDCCRANMWVPLASWCAEHPEVTVIVAGSRAAESYGNPEHRLVLGNRVVERCEPLQGWNNYQVIQYLYDSGAITKGTDIERRMSLHHSSIDCWCCTAYWEVSKEKLEYLREHHPMLEKILRDRLRVLEKDAKRRLQIVTEALEE
jgi:3'-phosphoadenosine 5'-phosphosulfate sulfotransferase (PAPS reductase)/FAD synthetase